VPFLFISQSAEGDVFIPAAGVLRRCGERPRAALICLDGQFEDLPFGE